MRTTSSEGRRDGETREKKSVHNTRDQGGDYLGQIQNGHSAYHTRPASASTTARRYQSLQSKADSLSSRARKEATRVGNGGGSGGAASISSSKLGTVSSGKGAHAKTAASSAAIAGSKRAATAPATRVPLRPCQPTAAEQVEQVIAQQETALVGVRGKSYRGAPVPSSLVDEDTPISTQEEFQLSLESRQGQDAWLRSAFGLARILAHAPGGLIFLLVHSERVREIGEIWNMQGDIIVWRPATCARHA